MPIGFFRSFRMGSGKPIHGIFLAKFKFRPYHMKIRNEHAGMLTTKFFLA